MTDYTVQLKIYSVPDEPGRGDRLVLHLRGVSDCWKIKQTTWTLATVQEDGHRVRSVKFRNACAEDMLNAALGEVDVARSFFIGADFVWLNGASLSAIDYKWRISRGHVGLGVDFLGQTKSTNEDRSLYLMKDCSNGFYKIGISSSPKLRESTLQAERPSIKMVGQWDGMSWMERELHKRFADQRLRGEWFNLEPAQVRWVCHHLTRATNE